jgi:hypothetical protein
VHKSQLRRRVTLRTVTYTLFCYEYSLASESSWSPTFEKHLLETEKQAWVSPTCQKVGAISKPRLKRAMPCDFCWVADPDPAFFLIADPDPGFDDLKLIKIYSWKFNFYFLGQKLQFTYP